MNSGMPGRRWYQKAASVFFFILCFEVGVFLLVFPWMDSWSVNAVSFANPVLHEVWTNSFFRGAVSGLGVLNLYISLLEIVRMRRVSEPPGESN